MSKAPYKLILTFGCSESPDELFSRLKESASSGWGVSLDVSLLETECEHGRESGIFYPGQLLSVSLKTTNRPGYVYFLSSPLGIKIGCTKNLEKRIEQLSSILPFETTLLGSIWCPDDMFKTELSIHQEFEASRVRGEWFDISPEQVERLCKVD